jgi:hypothetical protein
VQVPPLQQLSVPLPGVHTSPAILHPLATWHTWPPVLVVMHRWLQHEVPFAHGSPSTRQPPDPVAPTRAPQVPALLPIAMVQIDEQQSVALKQRSPSAAHCAPLAAQRPPWQVFEQHFALAAQVSPSVAQAPATSGWHMPFTQLLVQHSVLAPQAVALGLQI